MGIFGAPVAGEDDALRAVRTALAMRAEIERGNEGSADPEKRIAIGLGIATGEVMCGVFGSSRKKEYTALGTAVNLAARLENMAGAGQILVCAETAQRVKGAIEMEKVENKPIRGFAKVQEVFSVLGEKGNRPVKSK